jgi:hypothetical protein
MSKANWHKKLLARMKAGDEQRERKAAKRADKRNRRAFKRCKVELYV